MVRSKYKFNSNLDPAPSKKDDPAKLEIMCNSHKWGHIPHRNRIPTELPDEYKTKMISLNNSDVVIFSTLLLHRSVKTKSSRLALPLIIKNFKIKDNSFLENRSWKIFSYSEITKIERYLGNHYLSPYRVLNNKTDLFSGTIKEINLDLIKLFQTMFNKFFEVNFLK